MLSHENANEMIKRADSAMYASKEAGRNCVYLHDGKDFSRVVENEATVLAAGDAQPQSPPLPETGRKTRNRTRSGDRDQDPTEAAGRRKRLWIFPGAPAFASRSETEWPNGSAEVPLSRSP